MKKKILILLIVASYLSKVNITLSQVEPFLVNLNKEMRLPDVFPLAENHFFFEHETPISEIKILSDSVLWKVKRGLNGLVILSSIANSRSSTVYLDSVVQIQIKLTNGEFLCIVAPITAMAEVKVEPLSSLREYQKIDELSCEDKVVFRAKWAYPSYAQKGQRLNVVLDMAIYVNDQRIQGFTGWYDAGDMTRMQDLSIFKESNNVVIKVERIKTLHQFIQNGKSYPLKLSTDFPSAWRVVCE